MFEEFRLTVRLSLAVLMFVILSVFRIAGQKDIIVTNIEKVCYAGKKTTRVYIPPPEEFLMKKGNKGATVNVIYSGFNTLAAKAFGYAVSIAASMLPDDAKFTVKAVLSPLPEQDVLARSSVSLYVKGSAIDASEPNAYYPSALAEKIAGKEFNNETDADIEITVNSRITWFLGTSGDTPPDKYDMVTVVLHELIHGLGFYSSFYGGDYSGGYGINGIPLVFDRFVVNETYQKLTDENIFPNPSSKLKNELTGGQIYFSGAVVNAFNSGKRIRLFAPANWDPGSSIAHFDEITTPQSEALMTPYIDMGEAIHSPGIFARALLGDLGWINTRINHVPLKDTEEHLSEIEIKAVIKSDTAFYRENTGVVYSFNNFVTADTLFMIPPQSDDTFRVSVSLNSYNLPLYYYLFARDCFGRLFRLPSVENSSFRAYIGTDTVKPGVIHKPLKFLLDLVPSVKINAEITDNIGIDTAFIEFRVNSQTSYYIGLKNEQGNTWSEIINLKDYSVNSGDTLKYRISARDKAALPNIKTIPENGYFALRVEKTLPVTETFETNFINVPDKFINDGFSITKPSGFDNPALHTRHPYESPEKDDEFIEYVSVIRQPVRLTGSGLMIKFNEIVLVEPGEDGSVFGDEDFYDYVIVEGSTDSGNEWFPLADGYDSRISSSFLNAYNSSMNGINSTFAGNQSMYQPRIIEVKESEKLQPGDTLFIRFRLYSDPYAYGWGWAIDDLSIKPLSSGVEVVPENKVKLFPNPGDGKIYLSSELQLFTGKVSYRVINVAGLTVKSGILSAGDNLMIDISSEKPGIYFIHLKNAFIDKTFRYIKIK